jgi:hypothetical protein
MNTNEFTLEERKIIYNAVRRYQMNNVGLTSKSYETCDKILNKLFDEVTEHGFKSTNQPEEND